MNGENHWGKTPPGDFKVITLENPLLSKQVVTSKGIPVPYTNLQLNLYPNTQLHLFCSDSSPFWCTAPKYVTNQSDAQIPVRSLLVYTNPNTWLTPHNPLIVVVDLQQLHIETPIRSSMLVQETLFGYRTQRRIRNAVRTLSSIGGG